MSEEERAAIKRLLWAIADSITLTVDHRIAAAELLLRYYPCQSTPHESQPYRSPPPPTSVPGPPR